jgi:hypothetical protein
VGRTFHANETANLEERGALDASRRFCAERFALDGRVVERAIERGEASPDGDFLVRLADLASRAARGDSNRRSGKVATRQR